jgi:YgiT-type zinc finger domain-containing protein
MERPTHCQSCQGALVPLSVTHRAGGPEELIEIENVPALVCLNCGEQWLEQATLDTIERILAESRM